MPRGESEDFAVYRVRLSSVGAQRVALLAQRLSLSGELSVDGSTVVRALYPPGDSMRYWPLLYPFSIPPSKAGEELTVDLRVRGHAAMKNGLGELDFGPEEEMLRLQAENQFTDVTLILALAAATAMAGVLGFIASNLRDQAGKMMFCISALAFAAGFRIALNFVADPPMGWHSWSAINLSLLIAVGICDIVTIGIYLYANASRVVAVALATWLLFTLLFAASASSQVYRWAEGAFGFLTVVGLTMVGLLAVRVWKTREPIGITVLTVCATVVVLSIHDLWLHWSAQSVSARYLLIWSIPGLLILMTGLLMRHLANQRRLEHALQLETDKREDLLRDLHDGLGSRLVALAFHARQSGNQASVTDEIDGLIHELQLIQGTVRTGSTTLATLLADVRHLYSRVGGGHLPLHWDLDETVGQTVISAEQAVATVRIIEEAVANAVKHAHPTCIDVRLMPARAPYVAQLVIDDDGQGAFVMRSAGGLRHIELRAQRAGLGVTIASSQADKRITLLFPAPVSPGTWGRIFRWARAHT